MEHSDTHGTRTQSQSPDRKLEAPFMKSERGLFGVKQELLLFLPHESYSEPYTQGWECKPRESAWPLVLSQCSRNTFFPFDVSSVLCSSRDSISTGKGMCHQAWRPELDPQGPYGRKKGPTYTGCPLTTPTCAVMCVVHTHTNTIKIKT